MTLLNAEEFYNLLNTSNKIKDRIINFQAIDLKRFKSVTFINCTLTGNFKIYNSSISPSLTNIDKSVSFKDCTFNNCNFKNCDSGQITIQNSSFINDFSISNSTILSLEINNCTDINSKFTFSFSKFKNSFLFSNNTFKETVKLFVFSNEFSGRTSFISNTINNLNFSINTFSSFSEFTDNKLNNLCKFESLILKS